MAEIYSASVTLDSFLCVLGLMGEELVVVYSGSSAAKAASCFFHVYLHVHVCARSFAYTNARSNLADVEFDAIFGLDELWLGRATCVPELEFVLRFEVTEAIVTYEDERR